MTCSSIEHAAAVLVKSLLFLCALLIVNAPTAFAWGCHGHEVVALVALHDVTPTHAQATNALLAKFPSKTKVVCREVPGMAVAAHESTWADDYRITHSETGAWHFLDLPLSGPGDIAALCETGCVSHAIADEIDVFRNNPNTAAAADAMRFIIHLVGDAHQPLHAETNNDRGGNCIPVDFLQTATKRKVDNKGKVSYDPELHSVWDKYILDDVLIGSSAESDFANRLWQAAQPHRTEWRKVTLDNTIEQQLTAWVTATHLKAADTGYAHLVAGPNHTPIAAAQLAGPATLQNCSDNGFQDTIAMKKVQVTQAYVDAAKPVIEEQLEKGGLRLAAVLDALWTSIGK
jgi:hypothetical protein